MTIWDELKERGYWVSPIHKENIGPRRRRCGYYTVRVVHIESEDEAERILSDAMFEVPEIDEWSVDKVEADGTYILTVKWDKPLDEEGRLEDISLRLEGK